MGLGDFARQRSRGGVDGYDYDGGGYSVGMDSDFGGKSGIWGIAFGQMHGFSRSRDFNGRITQDSLMGSIYWGQDIPLRRAFPVDGESRSYLGND